jgi:hypothetical protein
VTAGAKSGKNAPPDSLTFSQKSENGHFRQKHGFSLVFAKIGFFDVFWYFYHKMTSKIFFPLPAFFND